MGEFGDEVESTRRSGQELMELGRETNEAVRSAFDRYDAQARAMLKELTDHEGSAGSAGSSGASSARVAAFSGHGLRRRELPRRTSSATTSAGTGSRAPPAPLSSGGGGGGGGGGGRSSSSSSSGGGGGSSSALALVDPGEEDVWLQALRWRLAATWQRCSGPTPRSATGATTKGC